MEGLGHPRAVSASRPGDQKPDKARPPSRLHCQRGPCSGGCRLELAAVHSVGPPCLGSTAWPGTSQGGPLCPLTSQLWPRPSQVQRESSPKHLCSLGHDQPECPHATHTLNSCPPPGIGAMDGDQAPGKRGGMRRIRTDPTSTQPSPPPLAAWPQAPGSVWGLPLPSPCLHSHLPVREPRPPHSSHSDRLLLTAQDRGQPGSSAMSGGGRKQVTGGQPAPRDRAALVELPPGVKSRGEGVTQHQVQGSDGAVGKWGAPQPKGAQLLSWESMEGGC